jgi:hypothetical protein
MNEHFSDRNFDALGAELAIQDGVQKMCEILEEFRKFGYHSMSYPYLDENDNFSMIHFTVENFSTSVSAYYIQDATSTYGIFVHMQTIDNKAIPTLAGIDKLNGGSCGYVKAETEDVIKLGEYMSGLEAPKWCANYQAGIERKKRDRAGFIGRLLRRFGLS